MQFVRPPSAASDTFTAVLIAAVVLFVVLLCLDLVRTAGRRGRASRPFRSARGWSDDRRSPLAHEGRPTKPVAGGRPAPVFDGPAQLTALCESTMRRVPLLNNSEMRFLPEFETVVRIHDRGLRVMAQVPLGEVLSVASGNADAGSGRSAFHAINAKRVDFAVIDRRGLIVAGIEYQGSGHDGNGSHWRDLVKRTALEKAGVPLIEIEADETPETAAERLAALLKALDEPPKKPPPADVVPLLPRR